MEILSYIRELYDINIDLRIHAGHTILYQEEIILEGINSPNNISYNMMKFSSLLEKGFTVDDIKVYDTNIDIIMSASYLKVLV